MITIHECAIDKLSVDFLFGAAAELHYEPYATAVCYPACTITLTKSELNTFFQEAIKAGLIEDRRSE